MFRNEYSFDSRFQTILTKFQSFHAKGASAILIGTFFMRLVSTFGSIVLVRLMDKTDYGVLSYMENLYSYAAFFAGFGLNNAVFRWLVKREDISEQSAVFSFVVRRGGLINLFILLVAIVAAYLYPHAGSFGVAHYLLPVMLLSLPLHYLADTCNFSLRALLMNRLYVLSAIMAVVLVWTIKIVGNALFGLNGVVLSWPLTYLIMSCVLYGYFRRHVFGGVSVSPLSREDRIQMQLYGAQFMVTNGLWALFNQNDVMLLGQLTGNPQIVASYKVAYVVPAMMALISSSIGIFINPYFIKHEDDKRWVWSNYLKVVTVSMCSLGVIALLLGTFSSQIVGILYGDAYRDSVPIMRVLLLSQFISNSIRYTTANLLSAMGKVRVNMIVSAAGIGVQVLLDLLLIPRLAAFGPAVSSIVVYTLMSIAVCVTFIRMYHPAADDKITGHM